MVKTVKVNESVANKINELYQELVEFYKLSLTKAIEIGKLLREQKKELEHGEWLPWIDENLPFSRRSATNYMHLYSHRKELKSARVADLNKAYKVLASHSTQQRHEAREKSKKYRKEFADKPCDYTNPKIGNYINRAIAGDNYDVMQEMLKNGMGEKYTAVITSANYNSGFHYGKNFDDNKSYEEYLQDLLKPFPLYTKLLRSGGRIIYIHGNVVKKEQRNDGGDYNHTIIHDLIAGVRKVAPDLRFYNHIIWSKGNKRDPLNKQYGTFANPKAPVTRLSHENILVWSNKEFELENIENTKPDITAKEFKDWAWSVWEIAPYVVKHNPHPCSFTPKLIERLLKFYTYPNDLILDPYSGVSTAAQVCQKLKRRYTTIELNPNYCEYARKLLKSA